MNTIKVADHFKGRPKSVFVLELCDDCFDAVRKLLLNDRHVTFHEIEALVGLAYIHYCMNI